MVVHIPSLLASEVGVSYLYYVQYYEISAAWMVRGCDSTWCNSLYGDATVVALMYSST